MDKDTLVFSQVPQFIRFILCRASLCDFNVSTPFNVRGFCCEPNALTISKARFPPELFPKTLISMNILQFCLLFLAGQIDRNQQLLIDYLLEGYTRIQGALSNLGHKVARGTVANVLQQEGIDPAPDRGPRSTWKQFLRAHWQLLAAGDFFTVEVWTAVGLVRYHVFFVIRLATRDVHIAGIVPEPHGRWMQQIARNITDGFDGVLNSCKYFDSRPFNALH